MHSEAQPEIDAKPLVDPQIRRVFTKFGVRMAAFAVDFFIILYLTEALLNHVLVPAGLWTGDHRPVMLPVMFLYFVTFWIGPLRSTPGQYLLGMRIVNEDCGRLVLRQVALRSAVLVVLFAAACLPFAVFNSYVAVVGLLAYALLFLAATTRNRQGGHDLLAQSLVVNRIALRSPEHNQLLREHLAETDPATMAQRKPSLISMIGNFLVVTPLVLLLVFTTNIMKHRDLSYRISYAMAQVSDLKIAVENYFARREYFPQPGDDLGVQTTARYPAGGYYQLEENGVIRIRFEIKPELRNGSIVMRPIPDGWRIQWQCSVEGDLEQTLSSLELSRFCFDVIDGVGDE